MSKECDSFVFYPTFYVEADEDISIESAYRMNNAICRFGIFGEEPDFTGWKQWERLHVEAAIAQIIATKKNRKNGEKGGRPKKETPEEAFKEKCEELDSAKSAVQEDNDDCQNCQNHRFQNCQNPQPQTDKSNVNVNGNVNVNDNVNVKRGGEHSPPALLENQPHSQNSVCFPTEKIISSENQSQKTICKHKNKPFIPPTVEEVAAYCKERNNSVDAESFVAFYSSKGWMVGKNKMRDWKQAVITWEKRAQGYQARGSPAAETRDSNGWNAVHTVL